MINEILLDMWNDPAGWMLLWVILIFIVYLIYAYYKRNPTEE